MSSARDDSFYEVPVDVIKDREELVVGQSSIACPKGKMKAKYLSRISNILLQARPQLAKTHGLEFKNCFGAVAGYIRKRIFVSCGEFGVALKLPRETISNLLKEPGARHLKYFAKGHVKKDYVVIPARIIEDKIEFRKLVNESIRFVEGDIQ